MKHKPYYILALLMLVLQACHSFKSGKYIIEGDGQNYSLYDPYIDEFGNEGVIAYISEDEDGVEYIIAISSDEGYEAWGPMGVAIYKNDSLNFDTITNYFLIYEPAFGLMMMQSMKSIGIDRFPAQRWCDDKNLGDPYPNASSWRLPTLYELQLVFSNKELSSAITQAGGAPLYNNYYYWTCLEDLDNFIIFNNTIPNFDKENRAVISNPKNQAYTDKDYWLKKNKYHVRAIKYIYYRR